MLRALASAGILALLAFTIALPHLSMFGRGADAVVRADVAAAVIDGDDLGRPMPDFALTELDGDGRVRFADVRENFHFWLDPELLREALAGFPERPAPSRTSPDQPIRPGDA